MKKKIKIVQLHLLPYADCSLGKPREITFTLDDIKNAIARGQYDKRSFQADFDELKAEWNKGAKNYDEYLERKKKYHIDRIAYFVIHRWTDPIKIRSDLKTIIDGQHRIWAAKYLKEQEIEACVEENESAVS